MAGCPVPAFLNVLLSLIHMDLKQCHHRMTPRADSKAGYQIRGSVRAIANTVFILMERLECSLV
jgi:hypothetical protein